MLFIILLTLTITSCKSLISDCNVKAINDHFDRDVDLVLKNYGDDDLIIFNNPDDITIPENGSIKAYCAGGFGRYFFNDYGPIVDFKDSSNNVQILTVYCRNNKYYYWNAGGLTKLPEHLICHSAKAYFSETKSINCKDKGFLYGFYVEDSPIIFATICYDLDNKVLVRMTYSAVTRSDIIHKLSDYVLFKNLQIGNAGGVTFSFNAEIENDIIIVDNSSTEYKDLLSNIKIVFEDVSSFKNYVGIFENLIGDPKAITGIPWWENLLNGNWKIYQQLLKKRTNEKSYAITAGKSHFVSYSKNKSCEADYKMQVEISNKTWDVPLYVWNHIQPYKRQSDNVEDNFVIIGVNSPIIDNCKSYPVDICNDICDTIDWLQPLRATRNIPNFGCVFCCKPDEARWLDGFVVT